MKWIGVAPVTLGIVALVCGGIGYNRQRRVLEVGGVKATATEHKTALVAPAVGAITVLGGVAPLTVRRRAV